MAETEFLHYCYYYGTERGAGHYLFGPGMSAPGYCPKKDQMVTLDGQLAPNTASKEEQFKAQFWRLYGYAFGDYSAFSWWDRTQDSRYGSNGIIFVPGHIVDQITMVSLARKYFPQMDAKISKLTLIPGFETKTRGTSNVKL